MIRFTGANVTVSDDGEREYTPRGPIWLRCEAIIGYYEHTVLVGGLKIWVMETAEQIGEKVRNEQLR